MSRIEYEYRLVLTVLFERYAGMAAATPAFDTPSDKALIKFIFEARSKVWELSLPKLNRWLGYIQGTLIAAGKTTVQIERDWTRPLLSPLDQKMLPHE